MSQRSRSVNRCVSRGATPAERSRGYAAVGTTRVLKRMRTSGLSDRGLLAATLTPSIVLALFQPALFAVVNVQTRTPLPSDPVPLVLAPAGGMVLVVAAASATSVVTPSPERAQITTLPPMSLMLGVGVVTAIAPADGRWPALMVVPGGGVGDLIQLAMTGGAWSAGAAGLPAILPSLLALVAWPAVFGMFAARRFRWDPRRRPRRSRRQRRVSARWKFRYAREGVGPRCPW